MLLRHMKLVEKNTVPPPYLNYSLTDKMLVSLGVTSTV